jgi:hypothetical protein
VSRKPAVRFAVVDPLTERHSGVFRVWTSRSDTYIASEDLGRVLKVSIHPNAYRIAYTSEHWASGAVPNNAPGPGRLIASYEPSETEDGVEYAWRVVFQLDALLRDDALDDGVVRLRPDDPAVLVQIDVWLCDPSVNRRPKVPLRDDPMPLSDGRSVWVGVETYEADVDAGYPLDRRDYPGSMFEFSDRRTPTDAPGLVLRPVELG